MLKLIILVSFSLLVVLLPTTANASLENALSNICAIVKADDKGELRKKMRTVQSNFSLKLRDYYSGIQCNGKSLIRLAIANDALQAGELLVKKMPKKDLGAPEKDGKTLMAWIDEQGLGDKPVALIVKERL